MKGCVPGLDSLFRIRSQVVFKGLLRELEMSLPWFLKLFVVSPKF